MVGKATLRTIALLLAVLICGFSLHVYAQGGSGEYGKAVGDSGHDNPLGQSSLTDSTGKVTEIGCCFYHLQKAIDNAGSGDTVRIKVGLHNKTLASDLYISGKDGVTLDGNGHTFRSGGYSIIVDEGSKATIQGLTFTNTAQGVARSGGVSGVVVQGDSALNFVGCELSGFDGAGALVSRGATLSVSHSNIHGNAAPGVAALGHSGGDAVEIAIDATTISGNQGDGLGGGISAAGNYVVRITGGSAITGNSADLGGGVGVTGGTLQLTDSSVSGNSARLGGGIYLERGAAASTLNTTDFSLTGNQATEAGGGLYTNASIAFLMRGDIAHNTAPLGGGIYHDNLPWLTIGKVDFSENAADYSRDWDLDNPPDDLKTLAGKLAGKVTGSTFTRPFTNAYNNYDVYIPRENTSPDRYTVTLTYYAQGEEQNEWLGEHSLEAEAQTHLETALAEELGDNWRDHFRPGEGYGEGVLRGDWPAYIDDHLDLEIHYPRAQSPEPVLAALTVRYYALSQEEATLLATETMDAPLETPVEALLEKWLGDRWRNLHRPEGYLDGYLESALPGLLTGDLELAVFYKREEIPQPPDPESATLTLRYYALSDEETTLLATETLEAALETPVAPLLTGELGDGWINLHRPEGHKDGYLVSALPERLTADLDLTVLYDRDPKPQDPEPEPPTGPGSTQGSSGSSSGGSSKPDNTQTGDAFNPLLPDPEEEELEEEELEEEALAQQNASGSSGGSSTPDAAGGNFRPGTDQDEDGESPEEGALPPATSALRVLIDPITRHGDLTTPEKNLWFGPTGGEGFDEGLTDGETQDQTASPEVPVARAVQVGLLGGAGCGLLYSGRKLLALLLSR